MTPSTRATCKFCGTVALPNDEPNCSSLDEAYRQTPTRPYGCPWFDKDARKANPAPIPSIPASTDAGALAVEIDGNLPKILEGWAKAYRETPEHRFPSDPHAEFFPVDLENAAAALRNSALQETRGDEPVAWRYSRKDWNGEIWRCSTVPVEFENPDHWIVEPLYAAPAQTASSEAVAWVIYAPNGNVRLWSQTKDVAEVYAAARDLICTPLYAAPQQSPRLEREAVIEECAKIAADRAVRLRAKAKAQTSPSKQSYFAQSIEARVIADAILALLSPDTTVASSTDHREVGK